MEKSYNCSPFGLTPEFSGDKDNIQSISNYNPDVDEFPDEFLDFYADDPVPGEFIDYYENCTDVTCEPIHCNTNNNIKNVSSDIHLGILPNTFNNYVTVELCNVCSLYPKLTSTKIYLNDNNIDLMFFTETWLSSNISDAMISIDGYTSLRSDRSYSQGGGVALFYKNGLNIKVIEANHSLFNSELNNFEFLCVDFYMGRSPIRFLCVYLPPRFSCCNSTVETLCKLIRKLSNPQIPCYIIGDFNLPKIDWKFNISNGSLSHKVFLEFCTHNGWKQHITSSTHIKHNILDLVLSNFPGDRYLQSVSVNSPLTFKCDHNILSLKFLNEIATKPKTPSKFPDFKQGDYQIISEELNSVNWDLPTNYQNGITHCELQSYYNNFIQILKVNIDKNIPYKRSRFKPFKPPKHIKSILNDKREIYKKYKLDRSLKNVYKQKCKDYENAVRKWKNNIEEKVCQKPSSKKFYSYINKQFKYKSPIPPVIDNNNNDQLCFDDHEKATVFNFNFQSVFTKDDGKPLTDNNIPMHYMEDFEITPNDILVAISNMKDKLTRSPEGIPSFYIKRTAQSLLNPLTFLFNFFLTTHFVPDQWKSSRIVPIYKKGDKSNPLNYRPISLTSTFSRLFESILHAKISAYLQKFSLISPYQYGFISNRSSGDQLLSCVHEWLTSIFKGSNVDVIYTDISKAFDTVSHRKLNHVIASYGINSNITCWIQNFLQNRVQSVCIGSSISSDLPIHSGVPQGSVIGPLLFVLYINSITSSVDTLSGSRGIKLFADDTKLYDVDPVQLQVSLNKAVSWLDSYQLKVAEEKCYSICLHKPKSSYNSTEYSINNNILQYRPVIKDLGVYISDDLKWDNHISRIAKKVSLTSYQILKSFQTKNIWILKKLFVTYIRPQLEYNTSVWSPHLIKNIKLLESVQKIYTKRIFRRCGLPYTSYRDRLDQINLESLERRRLNYDMVLVYKIINGLSYINFHEYFYLVNTNYNLRRNSLQIKPLYQIKSTNSSWLNSFFNRVPTLWNALPNEIVTSPNLITFKQKIRKYNFLNQLAFE